MGKRTRQKTKRPGGRSARVQDAVLRSALTLIAEKGADGVTVADVAERSGVHETSIYRRWATPKALVLDACMRLTADAVPAPDTGSLRSDLVAMMRAAVALHRSPQGQIIVALNRLGDDKAQCARRDFWRERFRLLQPMFDRAVVRGEFPTDVDPLPLLETLIAPLHFRLLVSAESLDDWPIVEMVERVLKGYEASLPKKTGRTSKR